MNKFETLCNEYRENKRLIEELEAMNESIKGDIIALMGGRETVIEGSTKAMYKNVTASKLDGKALKEDHPDIAQAYTRETSTRRFLFSLVLSQKLRSAIKKQNQETNYDLEFFLKNILINGQKRGCSGFIKNKGNGSCVYVTTEKLGYTPLHYMYRYADNEKDFRGYHNRWTQTFKSEELAREIVNLLEKTPAEARDCRV